MSLITIKNLDVVFGDSPEKAFPLMDQGCSRDEIMERTGNILGVHNANISVNEGEICVLMGLSGSGKSSLLRTLNGLNPVSRGSLEINGPDGVIDVANCSAATMRHLRTNRVSMVFQQFALMPWLSVLDNVAFGLQIKNVSKKERRRQAMEKLEMVGLEEWAKSMPDELSGGMRQRVGLARAFAMDTDILLMDEPFSALDPLIRTQLQDELIELQKNLSKTVLFVSHDLDEALKIGSNIAIMESAKIIQHGEPEQIVLHPENSYVENFVSHTNPLNVLMGHTLMSPVEKLERDGSHLFLDHTKSTWIELDSNGGPVKGGRGTQTFPIASTVNANATRDCFSLVRKDISMRQAVEMRFNSRLPVLVIEEGRVLGVLNDNNFYYALLGKHFIAD